ncbi:MAG: DsbC family protein [Xanthomonadales bacterium]|nr:Thiol:disulfide interchange protein DsbC [Xanthomonadales bacterium]MCC6592922.1 DsbC family protein [Xanthomonadales bacterium]MCE7930468.1 DsbC family protein [Xanthomonadales bacterium PRO6]
MRFALGVAVCGLLTGTVAFADDSLKSAVEAALKTFDPALKVEEVRETPIEGIYEVTLPGQVVYTTADAKYLLLGPMLQVADKTDLTEERRAELRRGLLSQAPSSQRIVFKPKGQVKHTVAVFTDIDCGYCRELHKHMTEYNDRGIQVEYLMFPRAGVGSDSFRKAVAAWCSKNPQETLTKAKAGEDPGNGSCVNPVEAQYQLGQRMGVNGTPTLVFPDGHVAPGYVTPEQLEQQLTLAEKRLAEAGK